MNAVGCFVRFLGQDVGRSRVLFCFDGVPVFSAVQLFDSSRSAWFVQFVLLLLC